MINQGIILLIACIIVIGIVWGISPWIENKLKGIGQEVSVVGSGEHWMMKYDLIKDSSEKYRLVLRIERDNLPMFLKMLKRQDMIQAKKSELSLFNRIVEKLDQSTAPEEILGENILDGSLLGKEILDRVASKTEKLFGLSLPKVDQRVDQIYRLLQMIDIDRTVMDQDSWSLQIPLHLVRKQSDLIHLRFESDVEFLVNSNSIRIYPKNNRANQVIIHLV